MSKKKRKNKKEGNSRNYHSNNIMKSKQERENLALNELTNVLNQHYLLNQNYINQRSSDLIAGGTYGGNAGPCNGGAMMYNP